MMTINVSLVGWQKNSVRFAHWEDELELSAIRNISDPTELKPMHEKRITLI